MTSRQSKTNNINRPLSGDPSGNTFTGAWESSAGALVLGAFVASPTLALVTIEQSVNRGVTIQLTDTFNIGLTQIDKMNVFRVPSGFAWFRVTIENFEGNQTYLSLNTYLESSYIEPTTTVSIGGVVDVSGSVVATNLITETLATRRVDFLVAGDWYRVASVGLTTGAEWQVISGGTACVGGQSVPDIGRLFKCVVAGPAVAGGGECYDVEYTDDVSATITNFPSFPAVQAVSGTVSLTDPTTVRVRDTYGDPIVTTAGNLMVGIGNIYTANPLHTIVDSGPATQAVTGTFFQATQPVSIASPVAVTGAFYQATQPVSGTFYPAVQDVSGTFWQATQPVSIATLPSLATGTNSIGKVSEITNTVTTKITNSIYTNARVLDLSTTGHVVKASAGTLRGISCSNHDNSLYAYVKIYDKATAPTSADTPICTLPIVKQQSETYDFFSLEMNNGISIRASGGIADNDNTGISNCTVFVSYDGV